MVKTYWKLTALAGALVLLLAACQTTEAPTVVGETPAPGGDPVLGSEWSTIWQSAFVRVPDTDLGTFDGSIEILGTGMGGRYVPGPPNPECTEEASIVVPDIASVAALRVQVALKEPPDDAVVRFENSSRGVLASVPYSSDKRTVSGAFFEATFAVEEGKIDVEDDLGVISSVDVSDGTIVAVIEQGLQDGADRCTPRSFVALVLREDPGVQGYWLVNYHDIWEGAQSHANYVESADETITIPDSSVERALSVAYALSDKSGDGRPIDVTITVGLDTEPTQRITVPNMGEQLYLEPSAVADVILPANSGPVDVTIKVVSPRSPAGDSVWLVGFTANVRDIPPPPPPDGCTLTRGYWQTHSKYGPAPYDPTWALVPDDGEDTVFFLSGQTYYQVMWTAPRGGNAYYILAPQWIAAYLNVLNGADIPAGVLDAWNEAQVLFETYTPAQVGARRFAERDTFVDLAGILDDYNNGLLGVPHCDTLD